MAETKRNKSISHRMSVQLFIHNLLVLQQRKTDNNGGHIKSGKTPHLMKKENYKAELSDSGRIEMEPKQKRAETSKGHDFKVWDKTTCNGKFYPAESYGCNGCADKSTAGL